MLWVRRRDLILLVLTCGLAVAYFAAGKYVSRHVERMDTVRVVGALMTAGMAESAPQPGSSLQPLFGGIARGPVHTQPVREETTKAGQLHGQTATVEGVAWAWRWMMWVLAGWLQLAALFGAISGRLRKWQLLAATGILLSTAGTGVGLWLLVNPAWGGMPPLSPLTYVAAPAVQAFYALVLIAAYGRRMPQGPEGDSYSKLKIEN